MPAAISHNYLMREAGAFCLLSAEEEMFEQPSTLSDTLNPFAVTPNTTMYAIVRKMKAM